MNQKAKKPVAAVFICQQCGCKANAKLPNGRRQCNPVAQAFVKELAAAVKQSPELAESLAVRATRCQGACDAPIAWALNSEKGEGWQFSGAGKVVSVEDILVVAKAYLTATLKGVRGEKTAWPEHVRPQFVVRIPAWPQVAKWVRKPR